MRHVHIAILGAGTAGLTALSQVRKHTDDFVIVNHGPYGTTCARVAGVLTLPFYHPVLEEGLCAALRGLARAVYGEAPLEMARL